LLIETFTAMARAYTPRMTEQEWKQVLPLLKRIKEKRLKAAYDHLVGGESLARAGAAAGMTRQSVHDVVSRVLDKAAMHAGVRRGWLRLTLDVPRPVAKYVQRFAAALAHGVAVEQALAAHTPNKRSSATQRKRG
jgi:TrfB plasmid transcriptional repressor